MIRTYAVDIRSLPDPANDPRICEGLSPARVEKILRYRQAENRKQSLGAGLLLKYAMEIRGVSSNDIILGENGKPESLGICFNLSHSGNLAICSVGDSPVGCDIEKVREAPARVADRYFCENEKRYLSGFDGEDFDREFFRLWTMKESYMKFTGEGMKLGFDSFEMILGDDVRVLRNGAIQPCNIKEYAVEGYSLTVCADDNEFDSSVEFVPVVELVR